LEDDVARDDATWHAREMTGWRINPFLCDVCIDDLLGGVEIVEEGLRMEGEDGGKRAVRSGLDAALADLIDNVFVGPT
jgi:hypothetical protein